MNTHSLTQDQIQSIYDFTAKKYVKFYDVQLELVDHIASRIEEMMATDARLGFDDALLKVYKSFGIYGFTKLQEQKCLEMTKFWYNKFFSFYLEYFKLPKILLSIALVGLFYLYFIGLGQLFSMGWVIVATLVILGIVYGVGLWRRREASKKNIRSRLLVVHSYENILVGSFFPNFFIPFLGQVPNNNFESIVNSIPAAICFSIFCAALVINYHAIMYSFPQLLKKEIDNHYGDLSLPLTI